MKKYLLMATLLLSATAFASNELFGELEALESEFQNLAAQEEARFNEEKAQAASASEALSQNEKVYSELSARVERLKTESSTRFYKNQYEELAGKYEKALKKLSEEMEQQKNVISDFQKIEALREGN